MVSMLTSSAIDRRFETQLGQTKDYKIGICYSVLRYPRSIKEKWHKDWSARNQDNVSVGRHVYSRTVVSVS